MPITFTLRAGPSLMPLAEKMIERGYIPPQPMHSIGWTAEEKDGIAGLIVLQLTPVIYPLIVEPGYRNTGIGSELIRLASEYVIQQTKAERVLAYTNHSGIIGMITHPSIGMQEIPEKLFEWKRR